MTVFLVYAIIENSEYISEKFPIKVFKNEEKAKQFIKEFNENLWKCYVQLFNGDEVRAYIKEIDYEE